MHSSSPLRRSVDETIGPYSVEVRIHKPRARTKSRFQLWSTFKWWDICQGIQMFASSGDCNTHQATSQLISSIHRPKSRTTVSSRPRCPASWFPSIIPSVGPRKKLTSNLQSPSSQVGTSVPIPSQSTAPLTHPGPRRCSSPSRRPYTTA